jgi:hypothetical protein
MIPNKIYFPADGLPSYIDWDGSPIRTKQVEDSDICYIRKDALMEWLENKVTLSYGVATDALVEVIDKLNSL